MNLDAVRAALVADAQASGDAAVAEAEAAASARVEAARRAAASQIADARAAGAADAEAQLATERTAVRRQARRAVLEAQARARATLIDASVESLRSTGGAVLRASLVRHAEGQLGPEATIGDAPTGGIVATAGPRRVDYSLPVLVERIVDALGPDVEQLWT